MSIQSQTDTFELARGVRIGDRISLIPTGMMKAKFAKM
jgi:hypothetical protein